jgi:hypothetical protein
MTKNLHDLESWQQALIFWGSILGFVLVVVVVSIVCTNVIGRFV